MFRKMRRIKQSLSVETCQELLNNRKRGVLSLLGDDDYPYGIPIDYYYDEETNGIYFHTARTGHKIDAIAKHPKASFNIIDDGTPVKDSWVLDFKSVIVFGKMEKVTDETLRQKALLGICKKFAPDAKQYFEDEMKKVGRVVQVYVLKIEHMTGKTVNES